MKIPDSLSDFIHVLFFLAGGEGEDMTSGQLLLFLFLPPFPLFLTPFLKFGLKAKLSSPRYG
jgi:hypothetical protein